MTNFSQKIFDDYQIRKTKKQKNEFIELMQEKYPDICVEQGGFGGNRNLVLGTVDTAKVIVTAHYDTCATLPFPNFLAPKNFLISFLYQLTIGVSFVFIYAIITTFLFSVIPYPFLNLFISYIIFIALLLLLFMGKPNKHTANDNTSGVISLIEMIEQLSDDERKNVAFVFFDNEENGLFGSMYFKSKHKKVMKDKLLINLDCVSDGDNIMLISSKYAEKQYGDELKKCFSADDDKKILFESSKSTMYPSDQVLFKCNVGICALKHKKFIGYYLDKIHTKHDVNFDFRNIEIITDSLITFIKG